jgi:hypothetical protein
MAGHFAGVRPGLEYGHMYTILSGMDSRNLTKRQAEQLLEDLRPMAVYLHRLQARMIERGFPPGDPLLQFVSTTYDGMRDLLAEAHYLTCDNVGRPMER